MKTMLTIILVGISILSNAQIFKPLWLFTVAESGYDYSSNTNLIASDGSVYSGAYFMQGDALGVEGDGKHWTNVLLKFSPTGEILWKKHYKNPNNTFVYGINELSNGNIIYCMHNQKAINEDFKRVSYGRNRSTRFGVSFLTLSPEGEEVNFFEMPENVYSCTEAIVRGDTIFGAFNLYGTNCDDPYEWNDKNHFRCCSEQVMAINAQNGEIYWKSKASSGGLLQGMTIQDISGKKILVTGFYHDGDMHWGKYNFKETGRHNAVIAILNSKNGKIINAESFIGDDVEMINTASFGSNGKIYAGGFSTGTYMKGPGFDFKKKSKSSSALFLTLDEDLQVLEYEEGWGSHFSRVEDMLQHDSSSMWYTGGIYNTEWHVFDTVIVDSHPETAEKDGETYMLRVDTTGKLLESKIFTGTKRVVITMITKRGSRLMITGFYEGEFDFEGFHAPDAPGTNAFYMMVETDPFAPLQSETQQ